MLTDLQMSKGVREVILATSILRVAHYLKNVKSQQIEHETEIRIIIEFFLAFVAISDYGLVGQPADGINKIPAIWFISWQTVLFFMQKYPIYAL